MSHIVPASFDPFATHPFTNNSGVPPQPPQPYPYPRPIPSTQLAQSAYAPPAPSSLPSAHTPGAALHAPQPQRASRPQQPTAAAMRQQPVFEPFRLERSSPDLKDVLAKKGASPPARTQKTK